MIRSPETNRQTAAPKTATFWLRCCSSTFGGERALPRSSARRRLQPRWPTGRHTQQQGGRLTERLLDKLHAAGLMNEDPVHAKGLGTVRTGIAITIGEVQVFRKVWSTPNWRLGVKIRFAVPWSEWNCMSRPIYIAHSAVIE